MESIMLEPLDDVFDDEDTVETECADVTVPVAAAAFSPLAAWRRVERLREERQLRERLREFYED